MKHNEDYCHKCKKWQQRDDVNFLCNDCKTVMLETLARHNRLYGEQELKEARKLEAKQRRAEKKAAR